MTLDHYFNIPVVNGGMFYEIASKLTVATGLEILSGEVSRLDESLLILKRLLQARSTDHQFYIVSLILYDLFYLSNRLRCILFKWLVNGSVSTINHLNS
jgi:hypothetical protein